jgi:phosphoribosylformylglycinamidine synthase subunit PurQ / glutaminase
VTGGGPAPDRVTGVRIGIVTFPGSLDDVDAARAVRLAGGAAVGLWHGDADVRGVDAVVLPGGFSYGDYLRCGAIARFTPLMTEIVRAAGPADNTAPGLPVLGICNGFQVLCESHLLPGALVRNDHRKFVCRDQRLRIERVGTVWTGGYFDREEIVIPLKNGEGGFVADRHTLDRLEGEGRVVARYLGDNPNGSYRDIAGISNASGTVVGLMPHPEHAVEPGFGPEIGATGRISAGTDGMRFFTSALSVLARG